MTYYQNHGLHCALAVMGLKPFQKEAQEFAPGIPKQKAIVRLPVITRDSPQRWALAIQDHKADKAGPHYDLRLVDTDAGKAHSWALPKSQLPPPGKKVLAIQTFTHTPEYALHFGENKPEVIGTGYGKGRVKMIHKSPAEILESDSNKIHFNIYEGKQPQEYILRRQKDNKWLLHNVTLTADSRPDVPLSKPKYKRMDPEKIDVRNDNELMQAKIDGAHNLFVLDEGKSVRIVSPGPTERESGLIDHTHKFLPGLKASVPGTLHDTIVRGELFAHDPLTGRSRQAVETGAVLNSTVWNSRDLQAHSPLRAAIYDIVKFRGKSMANAPYAEKWDIIKKINKHLPFLELPPHAETTDEKIQLLNRIRTGHEKITGEGVVLWPKDGGIPTKAKYRPDHDVYVRKIFPEQGNRKNFAGGFLYSWTPRGKIVGAVGTGFDHALKQDMFQNPQKFLGRVARVKALDLYRDPNNKNKPGALRDPSFIDWHLDKSKEV